MTLFSKSNGATPEFDKIETLIGPETVIEGSLDTANSVCVEGVFRGHIKSSSAVIVNSVGRLEADVDAEYVVVHGSVIGNIRARKQLDIGEAGRVKGDVEAGIVTVAKGGLLDGFCKMLGSQMALPGPDGEISAEDEPEPEASPDPRADSASGS